MQWNMAWAVLAALAVSASGQQDQPSAKSKGAPVVARQESANQDKAAVPQTQPPDPAAQARLDHALVNWEKQSSLIKTLDVSYYRIDKSAVLGETTAYHGRAMLKAPFIACVNTESLKLTMKDQADAKLLQAAIQWERQPPDKREGPDPLPVAQRAFYDRIICTGDTVYHFDGASKQIFEYPLAKEDREAALQQGPLRFLFNMRREDVLRRYHMILVKEDDDKLTIQIVPKLDIDKNAFDQAVLVLRKATFLPETITLKETNGNTQWFLLTQVAANKPINDMNFDPQLKEWKKRNYELVKNPPPGAAGQPGASGQSGTGAANPKTAAPGTTGANTKAALPSGNASAPAKGARR
jgi:TIGR03009 family protein